jgi:N-carbamoyl-L-amino-acid hydrolase
MQNLQIDAQRLWDTLMHTAQIGGTPKGGICRLTLTDLDRQVRDWFKAQCEALGCTVTIDEVGNMFARREGKHPALPPIAMGSHLDTQPTGGKFDGVLGVLAAPEAMRTLHHAGYETNAPIEIVNWTNEEGSRFAPPAATIKLRHYPLWQEPRWNAGRRARPQGRVLQPARLRRLQNSVLRRSASLFFSS